MINKSDFTSPKVCLVYPPVMLDYRPQDPPYGLLYLAAVLRNAGISVQILDINGHRYSKPEVIDFFNHNQFDIVGIGGMTTVYYYIKWLSQELKKRYPNLPIIAGGSAVSPCPEIVLQNTGVDVACIGETEPIIIDLVQKLYNNEDLFDISGIAFKKNGELVFTQKREPIDNIDLLPFPAYDLVSMQEIYIPNNPHRQSLINFAQRNHIPLDKISNTFVLFTSRGCPFRCTFCYRNFGRTFRQHSVDYVIKHIKYCHEKFNVNNFAFYDETFNADKKWVKDFCQRIINENLNFYFWAGGTRIDLFDEEILTLMKKANFYEVSVGVESFDLKVLKEMKKGFDPIKLYATLQKIKEMGMGQCGMGCLFGFKADNLTTLKCTIKASINLGIPAYFAIPCPYPGTEMYIDLKGQGVIHDEEKYMLFLADLSPIYKIACNISRYSDRDLLFLIRDAEQKINLYLNLPNRGSLAFLKLYFKYQALRMKNLKIIFSIYWTEFQYMVKKRMQY